MNNNKIVKIILAAIIIVSLIVIVLIYIYIYLWFYTGIKDLKKQHKKNIEIELINRDENTSIFNNYIKDTYGIVAEKFEIEIKPDIVSMDTDFDIKVEFMEKPFRVIVDTENKNIYMDNFYEVLSTDPKFQHLYSEWVKKQVGIEDENVELSFSVGGIDFSNIDHLSYDMSEIYTNTKMHCYDIRVYNLKSLNYDNSYIYANKYKEDILKPLYEFTGKPEGQMTIWIHLFANNEDYGEKYYFQCSLDDMDTLERSKI